MQGERTEDLAVYLLIWGDIFAGRLWHMVKWEMASSHSPLRLSLGTENAGAAQ